MSVWFFILPFLYWVFLFKAFIFGPNAINMDTFTIYGVTKYYFNNLLNGVVPLWDPFVYLGTPFYGIAICNLFNPVTQLVAVLKLLGMNYYDAFITYLVVYYFVGCIGFYFLAKSLFQDRRIAYAGYLMILFSGIGAAVFNQMTLLELFVPAVWFFYFAVEFSRHFRRCDFLGLVYAAMVVCISYLPFYFVTLFLITLVGATILFPQAFAQFARQTLQFVRVNILLVILCACAIASAATPLLLYKMMDASGEVVSPGRHCTHTTIQECQAQTLSGQAAMSYEETSQSGGLAERVNVRHLFSHLDKFSYGSDHLFFLPVWAYLLVFLTAFVRFNRLLVLLYFILAILTLIALAAASGVHKFLYDHIFYFRYFRNLFFFEAYIMPVVILIVLGQLKNVLEISKQKGRVLAVLLLHALFGLFLYHWGNIVVSSWIVLGSSAFLSMLYVMGLLPEKDWIWKCALAVVVLINPTQVFSDYARHAAEFSCPIPKDHVVPQLAYARPAQDQYPACRIFQFAHYEHFWNAMTMTDASGLAVYPTSVMRYVLELVAQTPYPELTNYIRHKFVIYNKEAKPTAITGDLPQFKVTHFDVNRVMVQTNFSEPVRLVYNDAFTRDWRARINGAPAQLQRVNIAFKGVDVPAGEANVEFRYEPPLGGGIYIFVTGVFIVFFLFLIISQMNSSPSLPFPKRGGIINDSLPFGGGLGRGRAITIYILLGIVFFVSVDFKRTAQERSRYLLGILYNGAYKNFTDGIVYFDYMTHIEPERALHYANLGECYFQLGKMAQAKYFYQEALRREPENKQFQYQLQRVLDVPHH